MNKAFDNFLWENYPSTNTPLGKRLLNKVNTGLDAVDDRVKDVYDNEIPNIKNTKLDVTEAYGLVSGVTLDEDGVLTVSYYDGEITTYNSLLGKLAINFDFNEETQKMIIYLSGGGSKEVDLSTFITEFEFVNSETISFSVGKSDVKLLNTSWVNPNKSIRVGFGQGDKELLLESDLSVSYIGGSYGSPGGEVREFTYKFNAEDRKNITIICDLGMAYCDIVLETDEISKLSEDTEYGISVYLPNKGKVSATIKEGSIQEKHLRPDYLSEIKIESINEQI